MSEQDFFFDEEPEVKTATKGSKASAPAAAKSPAATPAAAGAPAVVVASDDSTTWAVAALIGVIGLLLGAILGFVLGTTLAGNASAPVTPGAATAAPAAAGVPELTNEQLTSGELPAGHPSVATSGAAEATPTK